jgi:hypothetical protein
MANKYDQGAAVECSVTVLLNGVVADPQHMTFVAQREDGTTAVSYTEADAALAHDGLGTYHVVVKADARGAWRYRFYHDDVDPEKCFSAQNTFIVVSDTLTP